MREIGKIQGFTIVELLVVIIVIGVLAAIAAVSYNGIAARAKNAAIIEAAKATQGVLTAYIAANGSYPVTTGAHICLTYESGCHRNSPTPDVGSNNTLNAALATIGTVPKSVPMASKIRAGITYNYSAARMINGESAPLIISYYLDGIEQPCVLGRVLNSDGNTPSFVQRGYSVGNVGNSGTTSCNVSIEGPGV